MQHGCMSKQLSTVLSFYEGRALYRVFSFMRLFVSITQRLENVFFLVMHNFIFGVLEETEYRTYLVERAYYLTTLDNTVL